LSAPEGCIQSTKLPAFGPVAVCIYITKRSAARANFRLCWSW
jgi:hypothetical protein